MINYHVNISCKVRKNLEEIKFPALIKTPLSSTGTVQSWARDFPSSSLPLPQQSLFASSSRLHWVWPFQKFVKLKRVILLHYYSSLAEVLSSSLLVCWLTFSSQSQKIFGSRPSRFEKVKNTYASAVKNQVTDAGGLNFIEPILREPLSSSSSSSSTTSSIYMQLRRPLLWTLMQGSSVRNRKHQSSSWTKRECTSGDFFLANGSRYRDTALAPVLGEAVCLCQVKELLLSISLERLVQWIFSYT